MSHNVITNLPLNISRMDYEQIARTMKCHCGGYMRREWVRLGDRLTCDACGYTVRYHFQYTADGLAVLYGYGWRGTTYSDGTYPPMRCNETFEEYYRDLDDERRREEFFRRCAETGECPF